MSWVLFWQLFALVPWLATWILVVMNAARSGKASS